MASNRPIKLDAWGISWEEYKELTYFCLRYQQMKKDAAALLTIRISTPAPEVYHHKGLEYGVYLPHGSGRTSDPVAATVAKRDRLLSQVHMIEQAAFAAANGNDAIYVPLLHAVTTRSGVQAVFADPDKRPPIGERQFYDVRRKFFWILRELKNGDLSPVE